ncbi:MAG: hypothetical protein ABI439_08610 [Rhodospirillales bacterium]
MSIAALLQGTTKMMGNGEGWGMGWGMGGFGGIGLILVVLAVVGITVIAIRRRNSRPVFLRKR